MSSTDQAKLQVNFKSGNDLINVYAQDGEELDSLLRQLASAAPAIALTRGSLTVASNIPTQSATVQQEQPQQQQGGYSQPAQPQQGGGPSCMHGPRTFRSGNGAKGPWTAWFCSAPKGSQCDPEWGKK